jgi:hypothetical protein
VPPAAPRAPAHGDLAQDASPTSNGDDLEVQLAEGGWLSLRYEARWVEDDGVGHAGLFPRWHLVVATIDGQADVELQDLPPGTTLRWPES